MSNQNFQISVDETSRIISILFGSLHNDYCYQEHVFHVKDYRSITIHHFDYEPYHKVRINISDIPPIEWNFSTREEAKELMKELLDAVKKLSIGRYTL